MVRLETKFFSSLNSSLLILDEQIPIDFNPNQECLFCHNREEYLGNQKSNHRTNEHFDDDENAPLDLSLKSTTTNKSPLMTSNIKLVPSIRTLIFMISFLDIDHFLISSQIFHLCMVKKNLIV
jgi:hypothetical protein